MEVIDVPLIPDAAQYPNEKPVILFVHGALHGAWCYKYFQQYFADRGYITKSISLRGCGGSEVEQTSSTTISEHISDLNEAIPKLVGPASFVIVAHSMGGFLVQKWVEQNTDISIAGLVLMASTPPTGNSQIIKRLLGKLGLWNWLRLSIGFMRQTAKRDLSFCRELFFSKKDSDDFSEELEGDQKLQEHMEQFKKTRLALDTSSFQTVVQNTGVFGGKVMVVCATDDMIVDREANQETAEFWDGELRVIQNAPHDLMLYSKWEKPAGLILKWLQENVGGNDSQTKTAQSASLGESML
ncbi:unnamed protein product [Agarophyton chilense]